MKSKTGKIECYLFMVIPISTGKTELRGIATKRTIAEAWRKALRSSRENIIRAWVETAELDHCFGNSMFDNLTPDEAKKVNALEKAGIIKRR